nr:unnamed protein product [Spirometra erinaceieuropaei]
MKSSLGLLWQSNHENTYAQRHFLRLEHNYLEVVAAVTTSRNVLLGIDAGVSLVRTSPTGRVNGFRRVTGAFVAATALSHPLVNAPLFIVADASKCVIVAALQQQTQRGIRPLAFYSAKLTPPSPFKNNLL